ncbi:TVP38/TMEM64 family protein [Haloimpatiens sp. FM7330]|uniref:TVP38/TMEM64 family protein n=1 Tax=Haloimpatiens sp. FM7330 TaxID=3298610 RepID=UPI00362769E6
MIKNVILKFIEFLKSGFKKVLQYKKCTIFAIFIFVFILISYKYYQYSYIVKDPSELKRVILTYGNYSILAFLIMQVIQVVVFFIPGEIIQIAGGYIFGTFLGGIISTIGISIGSLLVYYISRYLGRDFVKSMISKNKFKFFQKILKASAQVHMIFLLYLVPGIPKDALAYICGVSDVPVKKFIIFSTLGRLPGIFISTYFGNQMEIGQMSTLIVIAVVMVMLFLIGTLKGEKILKKITKKRH